MSQPQYPKPAKLIIGLLLNQPDLAKEIARTLTDQYGPMDMVSPWFRFDYTDYYRSEMGAPLFRRVLAFKELIHQEALADIKLFTNGIETEEMTDGQRRVNIDPGYLLKERFVLATGKNFTHRIYIGKKIYADLTLVFQRGDFQSLPWTYPDYNAPDMRLFLHQVRNKYIADMKRRSAQEE